MSINAYDVLKDIALNRYPIKVGISIEDLSEPIVIVEVTNRTPAMPVVVRQVRIHCRHLTTEMSYALLPRETVRIPPKERKKWMYSYLSNAHAKSEIADDEQQKVGHPTDLISIIRKARLSDSWVEVDFNEYDKRPWLKKKVKPVFDELCFRKGESQKQITPNQPRPLDGCLQTSTSNSGVPVAAEGVSPERVGQPSTDLSIDAGHTSYVTQPPEPAKDTNGDPPVEFIRQFIEVDSVEQPEHIVVPKHLYQPQSELSHCGLISLDGKTYFVPDRTAIMFAILSEGRESVTAISHYTRIPTDRVWTAVRNDRRFRTSRDGNVLLQRIKPPSMVLFDWRRTLVDEDAFDDGLCKHLPRSEAEANAYYEYLADLERRKSPEWYAYEVHSEKMGHSSAHLEFVHQHNSRLIKLKSGSSELLFRLKKLGVRTVLVTNCSRASLNLRMSLVELQGDLFDHIYTSNESGIAGVKLSMFTTALKHTSYQPQDCTLVSDSFVKDILVASNLGMNTVWFFSPQSTPTHSPWGSPDLLMSCEAVNEQLRRVRNPVPFDYLITDVRQLYKIWQI